MKCRNCSELIEQIVDPWGYTSYRGIKYGWVHSEPYRDGEPASFCSEKDLHETADNIEAEPEVTA